MHRHARSGALLIIFVLALLAGAVSLTGPMTARTGTGAPAVSQANVAPHPDDDEVALTAAPASRQLTVPTLFGILGEAGRPPTARPVAGDAHSPHHGPATQRTGPRQGRAPPAITDS